MGTCINRLWQGDPSYPLKSFVPVWNLRAVIWFPFLISSHFFCPVLHFLSCHFFANGPSFFQKILNFFLWMTRLFCVALAEQLDGSWYVRLAAMWHWYFPLYICVHFTNLKQNKAQSACVLEDVPLVEFTYLVFTCMPGQSYCRRLRSLLWKTHIIISRQFPKQRNKICKQIKNA